MVCLVHIMVGYRIVENDVYPAITTAYVSLLTGGTLNPVLTKSTKNYVSWIFTGSYSYKDKFVLNGNLRMDGSNQFGSNPKYRFLPIWSVSGKYTLSNENFLKDNDIISYLAVRASYGIQGNVDSGTSPDLVIKVGSQNTITEHNESTIAYLPNRIYAGKKQNRIISDWMCLCWIIGFQSWRMYIKNEVLIWL